MYHGCLKTDQFYCLLNPEGNSLLNYEKLKSSKITG